MSTAMTSAPSAAIRTACARPWPRAAPVMKATLPSSRPVIWFSLFWFRVKPTLRAVRVGESDDAANVPSLQHVPVPIVDLLEGVLARHHVVEVEFTQRVER